MIATPYVQREHRCGVPAVLSETAPNGRAGRACAFTLQHHGGVSAAATRRAAARNGVDARSVVLTTGAGGALAPAISLRDNQAVGPWHRASPISFGNECMNGAFAACSVIPATASMA